MKIICLLLLLQACVPALPKAEKDVKDVVIPASFPNGNKEENEEILSKKNWKNFFEDEQLVYLIETALKNNQELNILNQEINIANNEIMARQGEYLPKVSAGAGYEFEKTSDSSSQGVTDEAVGLPNKLRNRQIALTASWEVDIWKKLRNFAKSAYYKYLASIEGRHFAITQLVAEISGDYYELMALDNELAVIERYIAVLKQAQEVVKLQQAAARTTSLAVKRFDAEVLKNQGRKFEIQQKIIVAENHLNALLGRLPQEIKRNSKKFMDVQMHDFASGVPASLLDNRPDVKQSSLNLEAAKLDVKAVKAEFYPSLNIDTSLGYRAFNSHHLIDAPNAVFYNIAGGISAPLLNRNAIKADYFSANSKQIQAIFDYEQTFIKAFSEVSNQLALVKNIKEIYGFKSKQVKALSDSVEISTILFKAARADYLELLLTKRDYLETQLELIEIKQKQLSAYVNLYKALGGGWRDQPLKPVATK